MLSVAPFPPVFNLTHFFNYFNPNENLISKEPPFCIYLSLLTFHLNYKHHRKKIF